MICILGYEQVRTQKSHKRVLYIDKMQITYPSTQKLSLRRSFRRELELVQYFGNLAECHQLSLTVLSVNLCGNGEEISEKQQGLFS